MVIFHSDVSLPEGSFTEWTFKRKKKKVPKKTDLKIIFPIKAVLKLGRLVVNHKSWI